MTKKPTALNPTRLARATRSAALSLAAAAVFGLATPAVAQQTGGITGEVLDDAGNPLSGVTVRAVGDTLPQGREVTTDDDGDFLFRRLPPGTYEVTVSYPDGSTARSRVRVLLQQQTELTLAQGMEMEEVLVTGTQIALEAGQGSLKNAIDSEVVQALPTGNQYRDVIKLIPGVQYTEDAIRGPSAGGSGQDNVYQFDGVDVGLPLFGVLASEPSNHDIDQVSIVRGGAKAIGFNRTGGLLMNTTSKSGTNEFEGEVAYRFQTSSMVDDSVTEDEATLKTFDEDRSWTTAGLGGPIIRDQLFFYASYFGPERERSNSATPYGPVPDFNSDRDEYFGKLTWAPTQDILLDASYRTSDRVNRAESIGNEDAASTSTGSEAEQNIILIEGSWLVSDRTSVGFKYTDFEDLGASRPDTLLDVQPTFGGSLDLGNLDQMGLFNVPEPIAGDDAYNAFIQPFIDQYGYSLNGVQTGGGDVGAATTFNRQDFFRESYEFSFDHSFEWGPTTHDIHVGYQWMEVAEKLERSTNGWGSITVPGGREVAESDGVTPVYFEARLNQQQLSGFPGTVDVPVITSSSESYNFEINNAISYGPYTFNVGVLVSEDVLYGQGLARDPSNPVTGFRTSPGTKYKMYTIDWQDQIQPRLGVTWDYSDTASVYVNYARYNPAALSLARAASWDRNLNQRVDVKFDENGNFIEAIAFGASSGKPFQEGMSPRFTNEYLVGTEQQLSDQFTLRAHIRHRRSENFWEDAPNASRQIYDPPAGIPQELYIPNLDAINAELDRGSSYVIAQLDGAHTDYWEGSVEIEYFGANFYLNASYVNSSYEGNFDQDNTSAFNDNALFIGSSSIADGNGRQLWQFKNGTLRGDRPHLFKAFGFYEFSWQGRVGAYFIYQSGQPWEAWDGSIYGSSFDTIRFAEPAGSRRTDDHYQLDINYTQDIRLFNDVTLQLRADVFNLFDKQTGYNVEPRRQQAPSTFGQPRSFYLPRRMEVTAKIMF
jgi:hypothetical protein